MAVKCEILQNIIFEYAMANGFAILIPFSPEVAQSSSNGWKSSIQQKL